MRKPKKKPKDGTCCNCGYRGAKETKCKARKDSVHCLHWWEGEPAE